MENFTGSSRNFEMSLNRGTTSFLSQIFISVVVEVISAIHIPELMLMMNIFDDLFIS